MWGFGLWRIESFICTDTKTYSVRKWPLAKQHKQASKNQPQNSFYCFRKYRVKYTFTGFCFLCQLGSISEENERTYEQANRRREKVYRNVHLYSIFQQSHQQINIQHHQKVQTTEKTETAAHSKATGAQSPSPFTWKMNLKFFVLSLVRSLALWL